MTVYDGLTIDMQPDSVAPNHEDKKMGKGLLKSKTFWANAITGIVSVATFFMNSELIASNPEIVAGLGAAVALLNIVLRLVTKEPIKGV